MKVATVVVLLLSFIYGCIAFRLPTPLKVDCQSLGNLEEFRHRLKWRENAEDKTTIWLFEDEVLNMVFELERETAIDILDIRYSNDGGYDNISLALDGHYLGSFKTVPNNGWGELWNVFHSSGPIGGRRVLKPGQHALSLKVEKSDEYGVEIDYMRIDVQGSVLTRKDKDQFMCIHTPTSAVRDLEELKRRQRH